MPFVSPPPMLALSLCLPPRSYLPQDPQLPEEATVLQAVLQSDSAAARAVQSYERALATAGGGVTKV